MKENVDFKFRDDLKKYDTVPIELIDVLYGGIVVRYTKVDIKPVDKTYEILHNDNSPRLIFDYDILEMKKFKKEELRKDKRFNEYLGLVLNSLILMITGLKDEEKNFEIDEKDIIESDESRTINTETIIN